MFNFMASAAETQPTTWPDVVGLIAMFVFFGFLAWLFLKNG